MSWYKIANKNIISFDFDGTIFAQEWDEEENDFRRDENGNIIGTINGEIKRLIDYYKSQGNDVIIVTSRNENEKQEPNQVKSLRKK